MGDENRGWGRAARDKEFVCTLSCPLAGCSFLQASFIFASDRAVLCPQIFVHALLSIGRRGETEAEEWESGKSAGVLFSWATSQGSLAKNDTLSCDWGQCFGPVLPLRLCCGGSHKPPHPGLEHSSLPSELTLLTLQPSVLGENGAESSNTKRAWEVLGVTYSSAASNGDLENRGHLRAGKLSWSLGAGALVLSSFKSHVQPLEASSCLIQKSVCSRPD